METQKKHKYCVKCKKLVKMICLEKKGNRLSGRCSSCGNRLSMFISKNPPMFKRKLSKEEEIYCAEKKLSREKKW